MKKQIMAVLMMLVCVLLIASESRAAELGGTMSLLETTQTVKVYNTPNGAEIGELVEGTAVLTLGEEQNGWIQIMYQEITGYVQISQMKTFGDMQALDNEYADTENLHKLVFEEIEVQKEQERQEIIWGL